jgi:hypothetical protein
MVKFNKNLIRNIKNLAHYYISLLNRSLCLGAITHSALFGHSLVYLCFHFLLVVFYSRINFFFTQTLQFTKTQKYENTKIRPKSS